MTQLTGILTTLNHALPSGVDATRLAQWRLRDGRSYLEIRNDVAAAFDGLNTEIAEAWGSMMFVTVEDHFEYMNGGALTDMPDTTDLDRPEARKFDTVSHMLDLRTKSLALGGTKKYFRDARAAQILAQIRGFSDTGRQTLEKDMLRRFFTSTSNQISTSGYDVPFCNASSGVTYIPPAFGGKTFASTHTHYIGVDSTTKGFDDLLDELAQTVQEHGHEGPYIAFVAEADVASYRTLPGYVEPISQSIVVIDRGGETSGNRYFTPGQVGAPKPMGGFYIGMYQSPFGPIELRALARIPTGYAGLYKSYGQLDDRNPIAVRVHPDVGFGFRLIEEPSFDDAYPVKSIAVEIEYGVSCGSDRTIGAAGYRVSGGVWVDPTIG